MRAGSAIQERIIKDSFDQERFGLFFLEGTTFAQEFDPTDPESRRTARRTMGEVARKLNVRSHTGGG